jgi:hypothetical protein
VPEDSAGSLPKIARIIATTKVLFLDRAKMLVKGIKAGSVLVIELWLKLWLGLWLLRDNEKIMYSNHRLLGCMSKVVSITCANATTHFTLRIQAARDALLSRYDSSGPANILSLPGCIAYP